MDLNLLKKVCQRATGSCAERASFSSEAYRVSLWPTVERCFDMGLFVSKNFLEAWLLFFGCLLTCVQEVMRFVFSVSPFTYAKTSTYANGAKKC
ncbi:hypothetical protein AVEN_239599-1 [Araneus ventricosus]|uniref:Uncharacterized protein n=1 Tax=Araneus ventricosus TaxID=182803 RepID=A0A4Y2QVR5_ARAVE|nr:hypothetical protein AVEN_239599-1 [Araneus ventricosus]